MLRTGTRSSGAFSRASWLREKRRGQEIGATGRTGLIIVRPFAYLKYLFVLFVGTPAERRTK